MKLYLNLDEIKLIRSDLYSYSNILESDMKDKKLEGTTLEICQEGLGERRKLICYLNDLISKEEV